MNWMTHSESMFQVLIAATWQSALLAAVVLIVIQLLGRWIAPPWRVILSAIPLLRLVILVLPVTTFSLFQWVDQPFSRLPVLSTNTSMEIPAGIPAETPIAAIGISDPFQPPTKTGRMLSDIPIETQQSSTSSTFSPTMLIPLAIAVWITGVVFLSARWIWSAITLRRLLARGEQDCGHRIQALIDQSRSDAKLVRRVTCILTDEEFGPATCGLLLPKIVISKHLGSELSECELQIVIAHEMEHIRRSDWLLLSLGQLATTLHWFNPVAYLLRRALHREIELAVDASVLGKLGQSRAQTYGELLTRIASSANPPLGVIPMAAAGTNLRRRIEQLMRWKKPRSWQFILGAAIACLLAMTGLSDNDRQTAAAQEVSKPDQSAATETSDTTTKQDTEPAVQVAKPQTRHASGRVIDANGKPVAGARLFARTYTSDGTVTRISESANEKGEFSFDYPPSARQYESYHTWVYAKGHSLRVVHMGHAIGTNSAEDVEIQLPPNVSTEIRVLLPNGEPCVDAIVRPRLISVPNGTFAADEPTGLRGFFPEDLKPLIARRTDADGRATIEGIPRTLYPEIVVETPKFGRQVFRQIDKPLRLTAVGQVDGVLMVESPKQYAGSKIVVETLGTNPPHRPTSYGQGLAEVEIDENGRFHIPAMASGKLRIRMQWDSDSMEYPVALQRQVVQPNETLTLTITVRPTIRVTGKIVTSDSQEPVIGARISFRDPMQKTLLIPIYVTTDGQGRYTVRLPSGSVSRQVFSGIAAPYEYPRLEPTWIPADAKEYEAEDILIHPMRLVKGTLLNGAGVPIPETTVVLHNGSYRHLSGRATTKSDGTFEMRVYDWEQYDELIQRRGYWATLDRPAINSDPPQFTRLTIKNDNPDNMILVLQRR